MSVEYKYVFVIIINYVTKYLSNYTVVVHMLWLWARVTS